MRVGVAHLTVWRVLREQQLYPYHLQHVKALSLHDYPVRAMFCQWFLQQCGTNSNFPAFVIFANEAQFTRYGIQNFQSASMGSWKSTCIYSITSPSSSPSISGPVFLLVIYLDPTYFQTGLQGEITKRSWKTTFDFLASVPLIIENCTFSMMALPHVSVSLLQIPELKVSWLLDR
jgi:hypothetical protein